MRRLVGDILFSILKSPYHILIAATLTLISRYFHGKYSDIFQFHKFRCLELKTRMSAKHGRAIFIPLINTAWCQRCHQNKQTKNIYVSISISTYPSICIFSLIIYISHFRVYTFRTRRFAFLERVTNLVREALSCGDFKHTPDQAMISSYEDKCRFKTCRREPPLYSNFQLLKPEDLIEILKCYLLKMTCTQKKI